MPNIHYEWGFLLVEVHITSICMRHSENTRPYASPLAVDSCHPSEAEPYTLQKPLHRESHMLAGRWCSSPSDGRLGL